MNLKNKKILVTGGAGFIGSHLVDKLLKLGNEVSIVDNLEQRHGRNAEYINGERLKQLDIRNKEFKKYILENDFDYIFHLAACSYVPVSIKNPLYDCEVNIKGTLNLLDALKDKNHKSKLVIMSSASVYGEPVRLPITESTPVRPISPYGVSKLTVEHYCFAYYKLYGLDIVIVRNFSTYGPRQRKQIVYDVLEKLYKSSDYIELFGTGRESRDLIYVKDVVRGLIVLAEKGDFNCSIYNLATGNSYSIKDVVYAIANIYKKDVKIKFMKKLRKGDPKNWETNIDKINKLGFEANYTLEKGLIETIEWFKRLKKSY